MEKNELQSLAAILKYKGVGPQGSKSLKGATLLFLKEHMLDSQESNITQATLLTAFLILPNTEEETQWLNEFRSQKLPEYLSELLPENFKQLTGEGKMHHALAMYHKIVQGKELSQKEIKALVKYWLDNNSSKTLIAGTLEGLRLRRETFNENLQIWKSLLSRSQSREAQVDRIVDIADIYNGHNRFPLLSPAIACILSAAGLSVSLHGLEQAPPKFGVTTNQILKAAGVNPFISLDDSRHCLEEIGWTYTDQSVFFPDLHQLIQTRIEMVKRPCLATFEKLLQPIRHNKGNDIVCGYTHKGYRDLLPQLAKDVMEHTPIGAFLNLKGLEGGPMTPGNRTTLFSNLIDWEILEGEVSPESLELEPFQIELDKERSATEHLEMNIRALQDPESIEAKQVHYFSAVILASLNPAVPAPAIARTIGSCLQNKSALKKWHEFLEFHHQLNHLRENKDHV